PPGASASALEHLAGDDGILGGDRGLFLGETWRMRPEITAFTSELFYENALRARDDLSEQRLRLSTGDEVHGLFAVPVDHAGNSRESYEEARAVVELFHRLLADGATFTDRTGAVRPLRLDDVVVVAPYNAQVARTREA